MGGALIVLPIGAVGVKEAVVVARMDRSGEKYLVAYVIPRELVQTEDLNPAVLRAYLASRLPQYMVPGAFVIARATAATYRSKTEDIRRIGRDLNVRYVVRGSIQRFGQVLRVNAELGSTETGAQLWSDSFDQKITDLAAGQEQIVVRMRRALNISLLDIEVARSLREHPAQPDAADLILRAQAIELLPMTKDTVAKALVSDGLSLVKSCIEFVGFRIESKIPSNRSRNDHRSCEACGGCRGCTTSLG